MKKLFPLFLVFLLFFGCAEKTPLPAPEGTSITDALGRTCALTTDAKVVSCYASFADMWQLAGGTLSAVTEDAITEHQLDVGPDTAIIGSVKHIDLEQVVALEPDYVMLSADLAAHLSLRESLDTMGIPYGYFQVDDFGDYKALMGQFCRITGRDDLYRQNVLDVEQAILDIKERIPETDATVLLLRTYSTGMKAKTSDNLAGQILEELGLTNIAAGHKTMLEDLSLEHILQADPDYIFALTMGDEAGALAYFQENAQSNPAWASLTAIQKGRFHMLPKDLFHYKPNDRWSESYAYLAKRIWPEVFSG